jgi:hypothetical protein
MQNFVLFDPRINTVVSMASRCCGILCSGHSNPKGLKCRSDQAGQWRSFPPGLKHRQGVLSSAGKFPERVVLVSLLRLNEEERRPGVETVFHGLDGGAICLARAFGMAEAVLNKTAGER